LIESTGGSQFLVVGSHIYAAPGLYTTSTVITLLDRFTITVTGVIQVFDIVTHSFGFSGGGGGFGGTPLSSPPASASPGTPSGPPSGPVSNNDHGSPAASFQAILFSPAANTPIGPPASPPGMRTGYFYPAANMVAPNRTPAFRTQESGTSEEQPEAVDAVLKQWQADFVSAPLDFLMAPGRPAPAPKADVKMLESPLPGDLFPEDSLPALVCVRSNSDLLTTGLPDDELERVTALALAGFTPVVIAPVTEELIEADKESDGDAKTTDRSAFAVEALVLVVCLCMWPHRSRGDAAPVID
jgi:hypothetical protein